MAAVRGIRDKIIALWKEGKRNTEIASILGCSSSVVTYHTSEKYRDKIRVRESNLHPFILKTRSFKSRRILSSKNSFKIYKKIMSFCSKDRHGGTAKGMTFTTQDVIDKFGENPKCYLTGDEINIYEPSTYSFDHIEPRSRGGSNTIDNLGICTSRVNQAKSDLNQEEFVDLCRKVVKYANSKCNRTSNRVCSLRR